MKNHSIGPIVGSVALLGFVWFVWTWGFCRFYVKPDQMAILTAKTGKPLPTGKILAAPDEQGIQEAVLGEGRYFRNPITTDWEIRPLVMIPPGRVGIVTSKIGTDLPEGEFLADPGQKGIGRSVLGPGKYRMNPYGYQIDIVDATSVPIGYVGVVTSLSGKRAAENEFAKADEKGIRADILQPGLYYVNPKRHRVDILEVGVNQVSLLGRDGGAVVTKNVILPQNGAVDELQMNALNEQRARRERYLQKERAASPSSWSSADKQQDAPGARKILAGKAMPPQKAQQTTARLDALSVFVLDQFVTFPSRDGFEISLDMTVEFELVPAAIPSVFRAFGDLPAVVDKVIMPQILSLSRLKGSAYRATEFIVGEGRERFQDDLTSALSQVLEERRIEVHNALIRHVNVPIEILDPIQQASIAQETDLTNQEKQNTARKQAELNTELSMIDQRRDQVKQETERIRAEVRAEQDRDVAQIGAETLKKEAEIGKQTAEVRASQTRTIGSAKANVVKLVEGERARGFQMKVAAFDDPTAYSLWEFASQLNPDVRVNILHAGDGTLWTDLQKAGMGDLGGATMLKQKEK